MLESLRSVVQYTFIRLVTPRATTVVVTVLSLKHFSCVQFFSYMPFVVNVCMFLVSKRDDIPIEMIPIGVTSQKITGLVLNSLLVPS